MPKLLKYLVSIPVIAVMSMAFIGPANAATPTWSTPKEVKQASNISPRVFALQDGTTIASWTDEVSSYEVVKMITKPLGSNTWTSPENVTPLDMFSSGQVFTSDKDGNMVVAWYETTSPYTIRASQKRVGQNWSTPTIIGQGDSYSAAHVKLLSDADGNTTAIWSAYFDSRNVLQTAELPANGTWRQTEAIESDGRYFENVQAEIAPSGQITVAYQRTDGSVNRIEAMTRTFGSSWSAPTVLSAAGSNAYEPQLASDPFNNVTVIWHRTVSSWARLQTVTKSSTGVWGSVEDVSADNQYMVEHVITSDTAGNLTLMWSGISDGTEYHLVTSTKPLGGSWTTPVDFTPSNIDAGTINLSASANGGLIAVWQSRASGVQEIQYATKSAGSAWSTGQVLLTTPDDVASFNVAALPNGAATAVWVQRLQGGMIVPPPAKRFYLSDLNISYSVSFDQNTGSGSAPATQAYTTNTPSFTTPLTTQLSKAGYRFIGWNTKADGTGTALLAGAEFTPNQDVVLYAQWEESPVLADTGNDMSLPLGVALILILIGTTLIVTRKEVQ